MIVRTVMSALVSVTLKTLSISRVVMMCGIVSDSISGEIERVSSTSVLILEKMYRISTGQTRYGEVHSTISIAPSVSGVTMYSVVQD
jgi:hypothetical protein